MPEDKESIFHEMFENLIGPDSSGVLLKTNITAEEFEPVVMALVAKTKEQYPHLNEKLLIHRPMTIEEHSPNTCEACGERHAYFMMSYFARSIEDMERIKRVIAEETMAIEKERQQDGRLGGFSSESGLKS